MGTVKGPSYTVEEIAKDITTILDFGRAINQVVTGIVAGIIMMGIITLGIITLGIIMLGTIRLDIIMLGIIKGIITGIIRGILEGANIGLVEEQVGFKLLSLIIGSFHPFLYFLRPCNR